MRQNRVTPAGEILATPERGTFLGNRGVLHDAQGRIVRVWRERRWIVCLLEFRGRQRPILRPGRYTELFFLDEATALAAGHRPCAECRRERFDAFRAAWPWGKVVKADAMDARLHEERLGPGGTKQTHRANLEGLPDGVFVRLPGVVGGEWLLWGGALLAWSPGGYGQRRPRAGVGEVEVLTPPSTVATLRAGYAPVVHGTAG